MQAHDLKAPNTVVQAGTDSTKGTPNSLNGQHEHKVRPFTPRDPSGEDVEETHKTVGSPSDHVTSEGMTPNRRGDSRNNREPRRGRLPIFPYKL